MNVSLRQLEFLVAAAEHLNFTKAAAACNVTQQSLGEQVRKLESALGVTLLERDRRSVRLTAAGEELVARARTVLEATRDLEDAATRFKAPLVGPLRLGVIPTVAPYTLPHIVPELHSRFPQLRMSITEDQTARLLQRLENGDLNVLLLALEADLGEAETLSLFEDEFLFAAASNHELASRDSLQESDLQDKQLLLLDDGHCLRDQIMTLCERIGASDADDFRAGSLGTLVQMVSGGAGVTLLPSIAKSLEVSACGDRGLLTLPFASPRPHRTIGLAWRRGSPRASEFRLLGDAVRDRMTDSTEVQSGA